MNRHPDFVLPYSEFVASRAKDPSAILDTIYPLKMDVIHLAWGIAGEVFEFYLANSTTNQVEELHDIGFYLQMWENRFGPVEVDTPPEFSQDPEMEAIFATPYDLMKQANNFFDLAKKWVIYNNESKFTELQHAFFYLKAAWQVRLRDHGITAEEAQLLNQAKLIRRYPEKYSDQAAATRADKPTGE